jgi:hypothetical protein
MAHHVAAVGYMRTRFGSRLGNAATFLAAMLGMLAFFELLYGGLSGEQLVEFLWLAALFALLSVAVVVVLSSDPVRRFLLRRSGSVACTVAFDEQGLRVTFGDPGDSPLYYPWSKVRAVDEDGEYIFVAPSSHVCFAVPKSAFGSPLYAEQFITGLRRFLKA